jgi:antirestriction protein ArdC
MIEFLESLKQNPQRWESPWILSENGLGAHNAQSKRSYSGLNQLILSYLCLKSGYQFNRWLTFNQVKNSGGRVKKGERSTMIVFSKVLNKVEINETSNDEEAAEISVSRKFILTYYNVFNVAQCEGLEDSFYLPYTKVARDFNTIDVAEDLIKNCNVKIQYSEQGEAFYTGTLDLITLPLRSKFKSVEGFYHIVFHEVGHWTGHADRLNRKLFNRFGSPDYAREELTAEMCSVFINFLCGIDVKIKNSACYIESWLKALRDDKTAFLRSTMQAQTAASFILREAGMEYLKQQQMEEQQPEPEREEAFAA